MTTRIIADIARKGGGKLVNAAIGKALPVAKDEAKPTFVKGLLGALVVRAATRSVPGAILIGGGLLAKTLYDRKRAKRTG